MLTDPLPVAASYATTPSIPATARDGKSSVYTKVVGSDRYTVTISHQETDKGRRRSTVRVDRSRLVADPYVTSQNVADSISVYFVIDRNMRLSTDAEVLATFKELAGVTAMATFANLVDTRISQIIAGES